MKGFFTKEQIQKMQIKQDSAGSCLDCGLYRECNSPKMGLQNNEPNKKNLIVLSNPTKKDDERGTYLSGDTGNFLKKKLIKKQFHLNKNFAITSAVQCRIDKPSNISIEACRHRLKQTIEKVKPTNIIAFGDDAVKGLLGESFKKTSIMRFRGLIIPDQTYKAWILPTYEPKFIFKKEKDYNAQAFYNHEISRIIRHIRTTTEFPIIPNEKNNVVCLHDYNQIIDVLKKAYTETNNIIIDYETTGLKPYVAGHSIVSISIDFNGKSYSFPYQYQQFFTLEQQQKIGFQIRRIFANPNIKKIAHNSKFEHIWTIKFFDIKPVNWHWCTLMGAHCQDNRQNYSGLKFQTYINFGHRPYDDKVQPYIDGHGQEFNRMDECPLDILLPYGGLDTRWCRRLYDKQVKFYKKNPKRKVGFDLFNKGGITLANVQHNGITVREKYCIETKELLFERIKIIEDKLNNSEEAAKFKKYTGKNLTIKEKDYSDHDLRILFYEILKYDTDLTTEKSGSKSVGKSAIESFDTVFSNLILKRRKLRKISQKIDEFIRCTYDGMMHPFFNLIVPVSYRGSCSDPNFQNIHKRDKEAKKYARRAIKARKGNKILESDFSGLEVCFNACYNKDPNLIKYIKDPNSDMHRDTASELFQLPHSEIEKMIRFYTKNQFVFPEFYGSWYEQCAKNLWNNCLNLRVNSGFTVNDHLKSKGITSLEQFSEHCKEVEKSFWQVRFKVYDQWKKDIQKLYQKQGYIETYLGFRFSQLMSKNEITNYSAQGTGFHALLWTLIQVEDTMAKERMKSLLIGQIHDSMLTDLDPDEEKMQIDIINHWGTKEIRKAWKWINVPLTIDHEVTDIDGTWYDKKEIK